MSSTTSVYGIIKQLQEAKGGNAKKAVLEQHSQNIEFCRYLSFTYHTGHNWFQTDIPAKQANSTSVFNMFNEPRTFWCVAEELYSKLTTRAATGHAALHLLQAAVNDLSDEDVEILGYMIKRDIRAGVGPKTINSVIPGLFPVWHYMRCETNKDKYRAKLAWDKGVFSQIKADGMFGHLFSDESLFSREGERIPTNGAHFAKLIESLNHMKSVDPFAGEFKLDGEILVKNLVTGKLLPREEGNGLINGWKLKGQWDDPALYVVYEAWDIISMGEYATGGSVEPYEERFDDLNFCIERVVQAGSTGIVLCPTKRVTTYAEVLEHYLEVVQAGYEGLVIKCPTAKWKDGTSTLQLKIKPECDVDLVIHSFNPGEGKYANTFGSITCMSECGTMKVNIGASSLTWALHLEFFASKDYLIGQIVTVKFTSLLPAKKEGALHSLFLPRFVELRSDKGEGDTWERIVEQYQATLGVAA